MAINKNHEFEELDGVKCAIVEKGITAERAAFLQSLLQENGYTVKVVPAAPPKAAPAPVASAEGSEPAPTPPPPPSLFTIGVTDVMFNPVNAIFGRMLKTKGGRVVTLAYWQQKENLPQDDIPYFERKM